MRFTNEDLYKNKIARIFTLSITRKTYHNFYHNSTSVHDLTEIHPGNYQSSIYPLYTTYEFVFSSTGGVVYYITWQGSIVVPYTCHHKLYTRNNI